MSDFRSYAKWLVPGLHIKRWLILMVIGLTLLSLGVAYLMTHSYRSQPFSEDVYYATLQFVDRPVRGAVFVLAGGVVATLALIQLQRSLLTPFVANRGGSLADTIRAHRTLRRGPKIVALGGGHGLATLLRGLKLHTSNLTAIVTVGDDGGSSGRLRQDFGVLPPGDIRMCLVALADAEPLMTDLFQYRFGRGSDLAGHSFGNLFLVAMNHVTGNVEMAIRESSRVLAVRGQILPATLEDITLCAEFDDDQCVRGESSIAAVDRPIRRLFLEPAHVRANPEAIQAIREADLIVIGPGSLYTSILPNLLVDGIVPALRRSRAPKVYVCNVATQRGETDGFTVEEHVAAIGRHVQPGLFKHVLVNDNQSIAASLPPGAVVVSLAGTANEATIGYRVVTADLIDGDAPSFHDSFKLADAIIRLCPGRAADAAPVRPSRPLVATH